MVLFWSPRNLLYPEKIIRTKAVVTSIAFSNHHPTCLAVGMHNGVICLFDTSLNGDDICIPLLDSGKVMNTYMVSFAFGFWYIAQFTLMIPFAF